MQLLTTVIKRSTSRGHYNSAYRLLLHAGVPSRGFCQRWHHPCVSPLCCHIMGPHTHKDTAGDVTLGKLGHQQKKCCLVRSVVLILPDNTMTVAGDRAGPQWLLSLLLIFSLNRFKWCVEMFEQTNCSLTQTLHQISSGVGSKQRSDTWRRRREGQRK